MCQNRTERAEGKRHWGVHGSISARLGPAGCHVAAYSRDALAGRAVQGQSFDLFLLQSLRRG